MADLIEDDEVVGMAYEDEGELLVEFYPDAEGEPRLYVAADLQRVLDTVSAMLGAGGGDAGEGEEPSPDAAPGEHPVDVLAAEFDRRALRRGPEDEGFYPMEAAVGIINRCSDLGLAVVALEGFTLHSGAEDKVGRLLRRPGHGLQGRALGRLPRRLQPAGHGPAGALAAARQLRRHLRGAGRRRRGVRALGAAPAPAGPRPAPGAGSGVAVPPTEAAPS